MLELPSGTVTFFFTDIQGSTPLWERAPEAMRPAVAQHHALLRRAIEENGGVVFKIIGDAFQAAFPLASQALAAAILAQHKFQSANWPEQTGPLKIRIGLHTGTAETEHAPDGGIDYAVSHTLNRVARIMSAGHGGQILLSREAADLVDRDLPSEVSLEDLGEHHLKGLARREHIFQARAPGLPDVFPPLATSAEGPAAAPNNLPAQLTSFIGRETELEAIQRLETGGAARLVTLTGPGGTGKTRLALQAASGLLEDFPDGVWLVELAPIGDPTLVPQTVANALNLHETPGRTITQKLVEFLSTRRILLILDNCEHVVEAAAALSGQLLQACPHLHILATSREILGTMGETPFRVPSLSLPASPGESLEDLARYESIHLFVERARTALPSFTLTEANASLVTRICRRLDGIPLAIELAAARVRMIRLDQIAARLDDSFRLLTGGSRTVLSRHQTLRALIDWSYNLLSQEERALFMRLSVFAGGFTLEAAEYVCSDPWSGFDTPADGESSATSSGGAGGITIDPEAILDLLSQLVDKSLVIPTENLAGDDGAGDVAGYGDSAGYGDGAEPRYHMLETIRQYARDKLHDSAGGVAVRDRHLGYFLLLAEEAEPYLRRGSQVAWLDRLDSELDNLRLALEWSLHRRVEEGLRLAAALLWFWHIRGHSLEGIKWLKQFLANGQALVAPDAPAGRRQIYARALVVTGFLSQFQIQPEQALHPLEQAVAILREVGPAGRRWLGVALLFLSKLQRVDSQRIQLMEEALPLLKAAGDPLYLAEYSRDLGGLYLDQNKIDQAAASFQETLTLSEETNDLDGLGTAALTLGDLALIRHDYEESTRLYEKSLACYQTVKNRAMEVILLSRLGNTDMLTGNMTQAADRFAAEIEINQRTGDRLGMINSLFDLARLELNIKEYLRASQRFAELTHLGEESGFKEAVLSGLLFQALVARDMGSEEQHKEFTYNAIDYWRGVDRGAFSPGFFAGCLENLAVLLSGSQPELAVRLFGAVDHDNLVSHDLNTPYELAIFINARAATLDALGEERFTTLHAEGKRLTLAQALELAVESVKPTAT